MLLVLEVGKDTLGEGVLEFGDDIVNINVEKNKVVGNNPVEFAHKASASSRILLIISFSSK